MGSYGCFICNTNNAFQQLKEPIWDNPEFVVSKVLKVNTYNRSAMRYELSPDEKESLWNHMIRDDICMKVFYREQNNDKHALEELKSFDILQNEIFPNNADKYTTYAPCPEVGNAVAFKFQLPYASNFRIIDPDNRRLQVPANKNGIYVIFYKKCATSLWDMISAHKRKKIIIDTDKLIKCLLILTTAIHLQKYAHMDIKPENIVYCPDDPEMPYKLIDYNLLNLKTDLHYDFYNNRYTYTPEYRYPYLRLAHEKDPNKHEAILNDYSIKYNDFKDKQNVDMIRVYLNVTATMSEENRHIYNRNVATIPNFLYYKSDEYAIALVMVEILGYDVMIAKYNTEYQNLISYNNLLTTKWYRPKLRRAKSASPTIIASAAQATATAATTSRPKTTGAPPVPGTVFSAIGGRGKKRSAAVKNIKSV
jgi:serine/threonine protein kinase